MIHHDYPRRHDEDGYEICAGWPNNCMCHICELKCWLFLRSIDDTVNREWKHREESRRNDNRESWSANHSRRSGGYPGGN